MLPTANMLITTAMSNQAVSVLHMSRCHSVNECRDRSLAALWVMTTTTNLHYVHFCRILALWTAVLASRSSSTSTGLTRALVAFRLVRHLNHLIPRTTQACARDKCRLDSLDGQGWTKSMVDKKYGGQK